MVELWFAIVAVMLTLYVVLDGFDLGAGALHLLVARTNEERRQVLGAIGPYWDGNEVWLLATGGALFVAFPRVLAAGLSGFYLAIFLVLWCLILRGIAIEFRSHVADPLWRNFWDATPALGGRARRRARGGVAGGDLGHGEGESLDVPGLRCPPTRRVRDGTRPGGARPGVRGSPARPEPPPFSGLVRPHRRAPGRDRGVGLPGDAAGHRGRGALDHRLLGEQRRSGAARRPRVVEPRLPDRPALLRGAVQAAPREGRGRARGRRVLTRFVRQPARSPWRTRVELPTPPP